MHSVSWAPVAVQPAVLDRGGDKMILYGLVGPQMVVVGLVRDGLMPVAGGDSAPCCLHPVGIGLCIGFTV